MRQFEKLPATVIRF